MARSLYFRSFFILPRVCEGADVGEGGVGVSRAHRGVRQERPDSLGAIIDPTSPEPATLIVPPAGPRAGGGAGSATLIANETGFPDLIVPAGITKDGLPVSISFGPPYSEAKLIGYAYDFEQATKARVLPKFTPALPSDKITY
jgi:Asp-tRNA(Asn)/Glu-tRNA(Gln) amidotransferase A subunit family amidase